VQRQETSKWRFCGFRASCVSARCLSRRTNIALTLIDLHDRGFERYRLWVLKNSFPRNPQKIKSRQDALQTTFSVFLDIFYSLKFWLF
jgi:hypothetical protein